MIDNERFRQKVRSFLFYIKNREHEAFVVLGHSLFRMCWVPYHDRPMILIASGLSWVC